MSTITRPDGTAFDIAALPWKDFIRSTTGSVMRAVQLEEPVTVETYTGDVNAEPGDWLIVSVFGEIFTSKDSVFRLTYREAPGG